VTLDSPLVDVDVTDGVATLRMDDGRDNALGESMVHALTRAFDAVAGQPDARVIVLRGGGEMFSSGAPRALLAALAEGELQPSDVMLPRALLTCPLPIVAALEGHAIGGGFALGLTADILLLAGERRYGFPFMNMGFSPGMGTTCLCEHVLSPAIAHELLYTGELRRGSDFAGISGINRVLPSRDVAAHAYDIAARIADKPRAALEVVKRTLSLPRRQAFEASLTLESLMHQVTLPAAARQIENEYVD